MCRDSLIKCRCTSVLNGAIPNPKIMPKFYSSVDSIPEDRYLETILNEVIMDSDQEDEEDQDQWLEREEEEDDYFEKEEDEDLGLAD